MSASTNATTRALATAAPALRAAPGPRRTGKRISFTGKHCAIAAESSVLASSTTITSAARSWVNPARQHGKVAAPLWTGTTTVKRGGGPGFAGRKAITLLWGGGAKRHVA